MNLSEEKLVKIPRRYYPEDFDITNWDMVEKELKKLLDMDINSDDDLLEMLKKSSEIEKIIRNEEAWRYINMTKWADKEEYAEAYNEFYSQIIARTKSFSFKILKKFYESEYIKDLSEEEYGHLNKMISNTIELYREENIPLFIKEQELANQYGSITSKMTVNYDGEEKTLQQLSVYLRNKDRKVREEVWHLINDRVAEEAEKLDKLFDEMKEIRIQIAKNAGFNNYRDYMHLEKGRFAYSPEDLFKFHEAVEKVVVPFLCQLNEERKDKLGLKSLKPWDLDVSLDGRELKPFSNIDEFVNNAIQVLYKVKPEFGQNLNRMKNSGFLDLDNRKGKAPGGYCSTIEDYGASFIFMNAVGLHEDVITLLHESGHAMHSFASADLPFIQYKTTPHEVAELASMSMEFLTMDNWNIYYTDAEDLKKAKRDQLENVLKFLPWCMIVDAFQHWIYTNPAHTPEERSKYFAELMDRFNPGVDWSGLDREKSLRWMRQLHIFEVPFYYIEYGIAQLGALAVYKNYKENKDRAVENYSNFIKLGYSKPMDEIYKVAGIKFDFSQEYIKEIVDFVKEEMKALK